MDSAKVIRLARDAGFMIGNDEKIVLTVNHDGICTDEVTNFAALIQQYLIDEGWRSPEQVKKAVEDEREACAAECEKMIVYPRGRCAAPAHNDVWQAAKAIRARSENET